MPAKNGFRMGSRPRHCGLTDTMATSTTYPRDCDTTNCCCSAPNGFGPDGNRVCLTFGAARDEPETPSAPCYEVCDFCDNMVLETEMGAHTCKEAEDFLAAVAHEFLEHDSDDDDETTPRATGTA